MNVTTLFVLDTIGFDPTGYDLVVTGEGAVDATTFAGKAPGEVKRRCGEAGVRSSPRCGTSVPHQRSACG